MPLLVFPRAKGQVENKWKDVGGYIPLYKAVLGANWDETRKFLDKDPDALKNKISTAQETALHIAVGAMKEKDIDFIDALLRRMSPEDLASTDQNGETALSVAAVVGNVKAAELLVNKNPDLPNISGKFGLPIHRAAQYGHRKMTWYLLCVTSSEIEPRPFTGQSGAKLLNSIITAEFFDIALILIERYPDMATAEVENLESPLSVLARKTTVFQSESGVTLTPSTQQTSYNPVNYIRRCMKKKRKQCLAIELVERMCMEILQLDDAKAFELLREPLLIAAKLGIHEIIEVIVEKFPPAIWASDEENNRNIFELAVLHRREKVFNLIYQMSNYKHLITRYTDHQDNNILHLAGQLPQSDQLKFVSGVALQIQRELQWFTEVQRFVEPAQKEAINKDGHTPWKVFIDSHQPLMKEGESWMKATATACTVASTLITTVVFTAAVRVPGGESDNGHPRFIHRKAYTAFTFLDAVSLYLSVTAIIIFLSILTSRYSEIDFLTALPTRLSCGLLVLFFSIVTMTSAFSLALYLSYSSKWAIILILVSATVVLGTLSKLMLPLLIKYFNSTFRRGIFGKQKDNILH